MFQKKGSDKYLKDIIEKDSIDALMDYYNKLHHTNPDDQPQIKEQQIN